MPYALSFIFFFSLLVLVGAYIAIQQRYLEVPHEILVLFFPSESVYIPDQEVSLLGTEEADVEGALRENGEGARMEEMNGEENEQHYDDNDDDDLGIEDVLEDEEL
tara:strand:- start:279 stop:596 length:318 start_codon:yes stop_codon:yes gene_type:complete